MVRDRSPMDLNIEYVSQTHVATGPEIDAKREGEDEKLEKEVQDTVAIGNCIGIEMDNLQDLITDAILEEGEVAHEQ